MTDITKQEPLMELFEPKLLALLMADIFTVLLLRQRGGITGNGESDAPKFKNRGMTLSVLADAINEIFTAKKLEVNLALPNLHAMMEILTGEKKNRYNENKKPWVIRPKSGDKHVTKSYFFSVDADPRGENLREQLEKVRESLKACLKFVEDEINEFDK